MLPLGLVALGLASAVQPETPPLEAELAAIQRIARTSGEAIWPGYGGAPFGLLLIEGARETLICQSPVPAGFTAAGRDPATGCDRFVRPRGNFSEGLLAAMPVFGPPSTIVMGTPAATGLALPRWRATVLHEHVHQWQAALPDYYARVAALDLAGGDTSGMWMLNFPFPYADAAAGEAYGAAARALAAALGARGQSEFGARFADYLASRRAFAVAAGPRNWRYLEFQLWQEGVARWTELAIGHASADSAMRADSAAREAEILRALERPDLAGQQRLIAYPMGAGEALLLEACRAPWRARYPALLALGPLLEEAAQSCA